MCLHQPWNENSPISTLLSYGGGCVCVRVSVSRGWLWVGMLTKHRAHPPLSLPLCLCLCSWAALPVSLFMSSQQSWEWKASSAELLEVSCLNQLGLAGWDTKLKLMSCSLFHVLLYPAILSPFIYSPPCLYLILSCASPFLRPILPGKRLIHLHMQQLTLAIQHTR